MTQNLFWAYFKKGIGWAAGAAIATIVADAVPSNASKHSTEGHQRNER